MHTQSSSQSWSSVQHLTLSLFKQCYDIITVYYLWKLMSKAQELTIKTLCLSKNKEGRKYGNPNCCGETSASH